MTSPPSTTDSNGRDSSGRFSAGNSAARGNPHARKVAELRSALLAAVSTDELAAMVRSLVDAAKSGDVQAAKVLFDRVLGPAVALDVMERLDALEARLTERSAA